MSDPSFVMPFARRVRAPMPGRRPTAMPDEEPADRDEPADPDRADLFVEYRGVRALRRRREEFCCAG